MLQENKQGRDKQGAHIRGLDFGLGSAVSDDLSAAEYNNNQRNIIIEKTTTNSRLDLSSHR